MRGVFARVSAVTAICIGLLGGTRDASAQSLQCGENYRIARGDTLSGIALRAYGRASAYQRIFDFNPGTIRNPNVVRVGTQIFVPCLDGSTNAPGTTVAAATEDGNRPEAVPASRREVATEPLEPLRAPVSENLRLLTGAEYAPYVDDGLPEGGFSTELVRRALQYGGATPDYRIDVIRDWSAHLQPLLSEGAYDLGYPWFRPDCAKIDLLGEKSRWRCTQLHFSEPLHEVVVTFYVRAEESATVARAEDVFGMRLCRPSGYFTHDLEVLGLAPPVIERLAPTSPEDCFEMLVNGEVDIVALNADTSDRVVTKLQIADKVAEILPLASIQTLHVVGMKSNPRTRPALLRIGKGLIALRGDGDFLKIAARHLTQ